MPEVIKPSNFPSLLREIEEPRGEKRKHDFIDAGEEVVLLYSDANGRLVRPKRTARKAGLGSLQREFGTALPDRHQAAIDRLRPGLDAAITAIRRTDKRLGLPHHPSTEDTQILLVREFRQLNDSIVLLLDILRASVRFALRMRLTC